MDFPSICVPQPEFLITVGGDACNGGTFKDSYVVMGSADKILPVDIKVPGNPPTPLEIMKGLLALMEAIKQKQH